MVAARVPQDCTAGWEVLGEAMVGSAIRGVALAKIVKRNLQMKDFL